MNIQTIRKSMIKKAVDNIYLRSLEPDNPRYAPQEPLPEDPHPNDYWGWARHIFTPFKKDPWENPPKGNTIDNQKHWISPEGTSPHSAWKQPFINFRDWIESRGWDAARTLDDLTYPFQTSGETWFADPEKKPKNYIENFTDIFKTKPKSGQYRGYKDQWSDVLRSENAQARGTKMNIPEKVRGGIVLPDNKVFYSMADEEARGNQYGYLRRAGWNHQDVVNYIVAKKYLPLLRHITGKRNFNPEVRLTDDEWGRVKNQMVTRQLGGLARNMAYLPPTAKSTDSNNMRYYDPAENAEYKKLLEEAFDHTIQAARKGQTPRLTRKLTYNDAIKNQPELVHGIESAANNIW